MWNNIHIRDKWNIAGVLFFSMWIVAMVFRSNQIPLVSLTATQEYILVHIGLIGLWLAFSCVIKGYTTAQDIAWEKAVEARKKLYQPVPPSRPSYALEPEELRRRSDQLDKVRSNLRNGISLVLGIGTALLVWLLNVTITPEIVHQGLLFGGGILVICSVGGILSSLTDPTIRLGKEGIGEGLLPINHSIERYLEEVKEIILSKEGILRRMRNAVAIGLLLFLLVVAVGFFAPLYLTPLPAAEPPFTEDTLTNLMLLSGTFLIILLIQFGSLVVGRHFLGITGAIKYEE